MFFLLHQLDPLLKQVIDGLAPGMSRFPAHGLIAVGQQCIQRLQISTELEGFGEGSELIKQLLKPVLAGDRTAIPPMLQFSLQA